GGLFVKYAGIEEYRYKMYASMKDMPYSPDIVIGNFRISAGQGLVLDNTDEYRARRYDIINGVFPDVIESYGSAFNGIALNGSLGRLDYTAFGSSMKRNALLNPDSTVNMLILQHTFFNAFENNVGELTGGGRVSLNLGGFMDMPISTRIGVTGYRSMYDRNLNPDTVFIDIPFDKDNISDPVFTESFSGKERSVYGVDFRTDYRNMSFEGEVARQMDAYAYVLRNDIVFDNFYLRTIYRHYDAGFDNPFARPLSEQSRFDDTSFEKEYRLVDPMLTIMTDDPRPKPEEGIYFETRYRLTEQLTLNKVYLDIWRTLDYNLTNYRFQGTIEYRPVFPLRIRLKQKIQEKNLAKIAVSTHSVTNETTLRIFALLSNNDYLNLEARYGRVNLTPSLMYGENYIIDGTYLNVSFEHEMTDYFSVLSGIATWQTGGMSQWIFEDTGIDFLYGNGQKLYVTMIDRLSDNISVRAKASLKNQDIPHTGIYNPDSEYHYYDGDEQFMRDFIEYNNLFNLEIRLDFRW
ncbi:MAG: hypothetical protein SVK54_03910, partial [candidate division WOR-3 bacterium]|nr:hypothetical protein [candidate division WOR-3 bacterium]